MIAAVVAAAVVALALITASVLYLTRDGSQADNKADDKPSTSPAVPSDEPDTEPSSEPSGDSSTDFPDLDEDDEPSEEPDEGASDVPLPTFLLQVGDCYDRSEEREGAVERRDCDGPHDAEVVSREKITGDYSTDSGVRLEADSLCRSSLRNKAAKQPSGTVGGTLITYPKAENVGTSFSYVTCSLTAGKNKKLQKPLV